MPLPFQRAQSMFGLPQSYGQVSDFFPSSGEDEAYINQVNETKPLPNVGGVNPALMAQAAQMGMDPFNVMEMAKKIQADIQGQRLIRSIGDIDFNEKDANDQIARLFAKNPLGAQSPSVQHVFNLKHLASKQGKDTQYDEEVGNAIRDLSSVDYTTDEGVAAANGIIKSLPPQAAAKMGTWLETHNRNVASQSLRKQTLEQQKELKRTEDERELAALRRSARSVGLDVSKYDNMDDLNEAYADKRNEVMQSEEARKAYSAISPEIKKDYAKAITALRDTHYDDEVKMENVGVTDKSKMTPQLWDRGFAIEKRKRLDAARAASDLLDMEMGRFSGSKPTAALQSTEGTASVPPPVAVPSPSVAKEVPAKPISLADIPTREERARAKETAEKAAKVAQEEATVKTVEGNLLSEYQKPDKKIEDLVDTLDDFAVEYENAAKSETGYQLSRLQDKQKKFLKDHGLAGSDDEVRALDKLILARKGISAGATSTGKNFTVGTPRKVD